MREKIREIIEKATDYHLGSKYSRFEHGKNIEDAITQATSKIMELCEEARKQSYKHHYKTLEADRLKYRETLERLKKHWKGIAVEDLTTAEKQAIDIVQKALEE